MGSSGASFGFSSFEETQKRIREALSGEKKTQYNEDINNLIKEQLVEYNKRDAISTGKYLADIKAKLSQNIEGTVTTIFGGSISKHTYVEGISDVDLIVILNASELSNKSPKEVKDYFYKTLKKAFPSVQISLGTVAITVHFPEIDIQLLPAIRLKTGLKIPGRKNDKWSDVIKPTLFARKLTVMNKKLDGQLIPTIKVIKNIISKLPENRQLSGYHIEAICIDLFAKFKEQPDIKSRVKCFFDEAAKRIQKPMSDISKQSNYIDEYLGSKSSLERQLTADSMDRIRKRIDLADTGLASYIWHDLLD